MRPVSPRARRLPGQGEDAAGLDDNERARLRQQSLGWLRADLTSRAEQLTTGKPIDRTDVLATMKHWQKDSDLSGIRDELALAKLPPGEREAFSRLWSDVAKLVTTAENARTEAGKP